jgi:transcriptional regulator GlxA family with amidase domain
VERARHLLLNSTLPIKVIAREVGIPDPHLFNKIIRRELGKAPREVRKTLAARENQ